MNILTKKRPIDEGRGQAAAGMAHQLAEVALEKTEADYKTAIHQKL